MAGSMDDGIGSSSNGGKRLEERWLAAAGVS
jgi:hypothetical protein